jgi:hypothetical protein
VGKQTQGGQGAGGAGRQTKAEKKEQARLDRIALERKMASRKRNRRVVVIAVVAVAALIVGVVFATGGFRDDGVDLPNPDTLPGMLRTAPPWSNNTQELPARLQELALPGLNEQILHHHVRLFIYVDGKAVTVPANIGLSAQAASPLHTHDTSGTVHVEADDPTFAPVLGQFFDVWGVYLTKDCLGGRCDDGTSSLRVFVNGNEWDGDAPQVPLTDLSTIVVAFGTEDQLPSPMPNTFDFGA